MPKWLIIVLAIAAVLVAGMLRERWRISGVERWVRKRGLLLCSPFVPGDQPPVVRLAQRFAPNGARIWGVGVEGVLDGVPVTIAEHETANTTGKTSGVWRVLVAWPLREAGETVVVWRAPSTPIFSNRAIARRFGATDADALRTVSGGLLIEAAAAPREAWMTEARRAAFESWSHGGEFVREEAWAGRRFKGNVTPELLDTVAARLPEARRLFE